MTTNQERALALLNDLAERADDDAVSTLDAVHELAAAGLLAPDHPEPRMILSDGSPLWVGHADTSIGVDDGFVYIDGALLTPDQAKEEAAMILAAANLTEKE